MSTLRSIEFVLAPPAPHMVGDGFRVHHFFPGNAPFDMHRLSPFLMLDYNAPYHFPPSLTPRGVEVHPHKGFETVSVVFKGKVAHHDSTGNSGVIGEGEVQWMTAGNGILHKEFHEEHFSKTGGTFHMAQLWVNLPAIHKLHPPRYQEISREKIIPQMIANGTVECIAGEFNGFIGPANTFTPIILLVIDLEKSGVFNYSFPQNFNACCLMVEGNGIWNGNTACPEDHLIVFQNDGTRVSFEAQTQSKLLFMAGEPINEPIASYGPFVMNTQEEIREALVEFRSGRFGSLR